MRRPALALSLLALGAACADIPALEGRVSPEVAAAPYPMIAPLGPILSRAEALTDSERTSPAMFVSVEARLAALRARAARLRGPVISPTDEARMQRVGGR